MKRLIFGAFAAVLFAACTADVINEQGQLIVDDAPETLTVGFEENDTRVQLNEATKTVWTKDDFVSVFYRSDANQKWQYQGETGERVGNLKRVANATGTTKTTKTVVVYPYSENYWLNTDSYAIDANLPATQHYTEDSYGVGCNLMVSQSEFTQFSLKSVCGWLKLQLIGNGEVVKRIKLCGNNGEQVAGLIYVDTYTAESTLASEMGSSDDNNAGGNLIFDDSILTEVTLDCGDGVTLGAEATAFYIALPPQTFETGFTVEVKCEGYNPMTISTSNKVVIERNHIQPMAAVKYETEEVQGPQKNEIWYTNGSTTEMTTLYEADAFDANIVSNLYDAEKECWVITFDSDVTNIRAYAFGSCAILISVTIPDSVTSIGDEAFSYCSSLTSITIPDSVTSIGEAAFNYCSSLTAFYGKFASADNRCLIIDSVLHSFAPAGLTEYTIPDSVTSIGKYAFHRCENLISITIPDSVTSIEDYAFGRCSSLTSVYCKPTTPPGFRDDIFYNNASSLKIYVPTASVEAYKSASGWSEYADYIEGYDF